MTKKERQQKNCPGYYEVSGYTTKDGKHVEDYIRQCWKHGNGGGVLANRVQNEQESIENTNEKLEEINNKETITDEDLNLSKGYLSATISKICEDCENYLEEKDDKTENPTTESIEKSETLDKTKDDILDNLEKSMSAVDKIEKIQKKKWDTVNTNDENYSSKLQEYVKSKETIENINKNLRNLHRAINYSYGIAYEHINIIKDLIHFYFVGVKMLTTENPNSYLNKQKREDTFLKYADKQVANVGGLGFATFYKLPHAYSLMKIGLKDKNYYQLYVDINGKLHNSINDIDSNKYNIQEIKNRVSAETEGRIKDCKVLILRHDSYMAQKIKMSSTFNTFLNKNLDTLKRNGSIPDTTIEFDGPDSDLYNSFHGANVKDVKYKNGEVSLKVEDFYNFNKNRPSFKGRIGEKLQKKGDLENYYIIVDIKFKL